MYSHTTPRATGSRPTVGSSSTSSRGALISDWASSSRRIMPPEYVPAKREAASVSPIAESASSTRCLRTRRGTSKSRANSSTFSTPVRFASADSACGTYPMARRTCIGCTAASMPKTRTDPVPGVSSVVIIRIVVVLPAPFGPSSPYISPGAIDRFTWSTARCVANW